MGQILNKMFDNATLGEITVDEKEMALINKHTLKELTAEQVFVFKLALCDNEIDRDIEQFSDKALDDLSKLFVGKTVISDHYASSKNQSARLYDASVETTSKLNSLGQPYKQLIAKCYMVRTSTNADLILEIEAGIKKEVSVSALCIKCTCSICGADERLQCSHRRGKTYNGQKCYFILDGAVDAYEASFVAVPAQPAAGVIKNYDNTDTDELDISKQLEIEKYKSKILFNN